jgi:hypothetical protein
MAEEGRQTLLSLGPDAVEPEPVVVSGLMFVRASSFAKDFI